MVGLSVSVSPQARDALGRFTRFSALSLIDQGLLTYGASKVRAFAGATPGGPGAAQSGWRSSYAPGTHTLTISNATPYGMALAVGGRGPYNIPGAFGRAAPFGLSGRFAGKFHPTIAALPGLAAEVASLPQDGSVLLQGVGQAIIKALMG